MTVGLPQRAVVLPFGAAFAGFTIRRAGTDVAQSEWALPDKGDISPGDGHPILSAVMAVVGAGVASRTPFTKAIAEVGDAGVTTELVGACACAGAGARPVDFVPVA